MRRLIRLPIVVLLMLAACLAQVSTAAAGGLKVRDDAGVLSAADQQTIRASATRAPFSVYVWTAKGGYAGNKAGFVSAANALVRNTDSVVVAVDTVDRFSHVAARNARLTSAAAAAAKRSADSSFGQGQWAAGISAALTSLTSAAGAAGANGAPTRGGNGALAGSQTSFPWGALIVFLVIVGGVTAGVMALLRARRRRVVVGPQDAYPRLRTWRPGLRTWRPWVWRWPRVWGWAGLRPRRRRCGGDACWGCPRRHRRRIAWL